MDVASPTIPKIENLGASPATAFAATGRNAAPDAAILAITSRRASVPFVQKNQTKRLEHDNNEVSWNVFRYVDCKNQKHKRHDGERIQQVDPSIRDILQLKKYFIVIIPR